MSDSRTSQIQLNVTTDANKVPTAIRWSASDAGIADAEAKAFVCQSMMTMADALERSTQDERAAGAIRGFTSELAERLGVGPAAG